MYDYNQDYFVLVDNFSDEEKLDYGMVGYGASRSSMLRDGPLNKPLKFEIDEEEWAPHKRPEDVILYSDEELIFKDEYKHYFNTLGQKDFVTHIAYFVTPKDEYIEGYWYILAPEKPKEWLDMEASELKFRSRAPKEIRGVRSYRFNNYALDKVDEKERQFFTFDSNELGYTHFIVHKNVMKFLTENKIRNFKCIPLLLFKSNMAIQGPLPEFAI